MCRVDALFVATVSIVAIYSITFFQSLSFHISILVLVQYSSKSARREKYINVLQAHIVIVGQVRILVFLFRYS